MKSDKAKEWSKKISLALTVLVLIDCVIPFTSKNVRFRKRTRDHPYAVELLEKWAPVLSRSYKEHFPSTDPAPLKTMGQLDWMFSWRNARTDTCSRKAYFLDELISVSAFILADLLVHGIPQQQNETALINVQPLSYEDMCAIDSVYQQDTDVEKELDLLVGLDWTEQHTVDTYGQDNVCAVQPQGDFDSGNSPTRMRETLLRNFTLTYEQLVAAEKEFMLRDNFSLPYENDTSAEKEDPLMASWNKASEALDSLSQASPSHYFNEPPPSSRVWNDVLLSDSRYENNPQSLKDVPVDMEVDDDSIYGAFQTNSSPYHQVPSTSNGEEPQSITPSLLATQDDMAACWSNQQFQSDVFTSAQDKDGMFSTDQDFAPNTYSLKQEPASQQQYYEPSVPVIADTNQTASQPQDYMPSVNEWMDSEPDQSQVLIEFFDETGAVFDQYGETENKPNVSRSNASHFSPLADHDYTNASPSSSDMSAAYTESGPSTSNDSYATASADPKHRIVKLEDEVFGYGTRSRHGLTASQRDRQIAAEMGLPWSADEIVQMDQHEAEKCLSGGGMTHEQKELFKGIRRRGGNKEAAKNSRLRKVGEYQKVCDESDGLDAQLAALDKQLADVYGRIEMEEKKKRQLQREMQQKKS